jgi:type II secretory pathway pseudopilin PulG
MKRRCLKNGGRERAFWGALIGAAASLIGTGLSISAQSRNQKEALAEQARIRREQEEQERAEQQTNTMNNYFATLGKEEEDELVYKKGGRRKLRNAGARITDGGYAIPIGNNTSLLQGSLHSQINESGNTGIGIKVGNKEIEAENGEVVQKKGDEFRVFSAQPMLAGISPAQAVMEGADEDKVFKAQESIKRRYHLRNGKSTPVERNKALWGATFTTPDYIGLGTNIGASLLSGLWANSAYDDLINSVDYSLPDYVDEMYVAGPTRWRNDAQRAEVERARLNTRRSIARNTASSAVGLGRMQEVDTTAMHELNKLWDEKANKETEMRQANAEREQQVRGRNAAARNAYYQKVAELKNQQLATKLGLQKAKVDSNIGMIQGIGSSIGSFLQQGIDNYQADQARRMQLAASQYGSAERAASMGVDFSPSTMKALRDDAQTRMDRFDVGSTEYNAALDSYNFWNSKLTKPITSTPRNKRSIASPSTTNRPGIWYNPFTRQGQV